MKNSKPLVVLDPPEFPRPARQAEITSIADTERKRLRRVSRVVLKALREDANVSQVELAGRLSWTRNQIANLETGRRGIEIYDFILIAKALRVDPRRALDMVLRW